jgi:hypothetical protein
MNIEVGKIYTTRNGSTVKVIDTGYDCTTIHAIDMKTDLASIYRTDSIIAEVLQIEVGKRYITRDENHIARVNAKIGNSFYGAIDYQTSWWDSSGTYCPTNHKDYDLVREYPEPDETKCKHAKALKEIMIIIDSHIHTSRFAPEAANGEIFNFERFEQNNAITATLLKLRDDIRRKLNL